MPGQDEGIRFLTAMAKQSNMTPIYYMENPNGAQVVVDSWARPAVPGTSAPMIMLIWIASSSTCSSAAHRTPHKGREDISALFTCRLRQATQP